MFKLIIRLFYLLWGSRLKRGSVLFFLQPDSLLT